MLCEAMPQNKKDEIIDGYFVLGNDLDIGNLAMNNSILFPELLF